MPPILSPIVFISVESTFDDVLQGSGGGGGGGGDKK